VLSLGEDALTIIFTGGGQGSGIEAQGYQGGVCYHESYKVISTKGKEGGVNKGCICFKEASNDDEEDYITGDASDQGMSFRSPSLSLFTSSWFLLAARYLCSLTVFFPP
jgi:hypothetical protein